MKNRKEKRIKRKLRIRAKVSGTEKRPRLVVFRSNKSIYVQVINDEVGKTLMSSDIAGKTTEKAKELGTTLSEMLKKKGIEAVVFDRGGYRYHGVVKALADAVREGGVRI